MSGYIMRSCPPLFAPFHFLLLLALLIVPANEPLQAARPNLRGDTGLHDPSTIIKCKDKYYTFATGRGIISRVSTDKLFWQAGPSVFQQTPSWATNAVPGFDGTFWAPDVFVLNNRYCLYYSISTWGSQVSAIGMASNPTLDPADPAYRWTDHGPVISSAVGSDFNTIDPSVFLDLNGAPWMVFGSYWQGIYLIQLNPVTGMRLSPNSTTHRLAWNGSIEASTIYPRNGYYYLFVNWGSCCNGVNSGYNIRVGRSTSVTGPYRDREGRDMRDGFGTSFLEGTGKYTGPGHVGVLEENGTTSFTYHYYDAGDYASWYNAFGRPKFDLAPLSWTADGWPVFTNDWSAIYNFQFDARDENGQYYGLLRGDAAIREEPGIGRVLHLPGTNASVALPAGVGYARTFAAVVNWAGGGPWQRIFDFGTDTSDYVMLTPSSGDGRLRCDIRVNGNTQTLQAPSGLPVNSWRHVALTLDGQRGILYLDGVPVATNSNLTLSPVQVRAQTNHLGHSKFSADPDFNGKIAAFRAYGRVLAPSEIAAPEPTISLPEDGVKVAPGSTVVFTGGARDFLRRPLGAARLLWRVEYLHNTTTNLVLGPITGQTNGSFLVGTNLPAGASYRVSLTATDSAGRSRTAFASVVPDSATPTADWGSFYAFLNDGRDSSNRFHGTLSGGASVVTDPQRGRVLNLSGSSQFVSLPANASRIQTISAWVKWNGGAHWQRVFDFGVDTKRYFFFTPANSQGEMECALTSAADHYIYVLLPRMTFPVGVWTHVAVALDGRQAVLYLNGKPVAVHNAVDLLPSDLVATRAWFGHSMFPADADFNGRLDSIHISSRSLNVEEIFAPSPMIQTPSPSSLFAGGQTISFSGNASNFLGAALPPQNLSWTAEFRRDGSIVSAPNWNATNSGSFLVPSSVGPSTNIFYRLKLFATDTSGYTGFASLDLKPRVVDLTLQTIPPGLQLELDTIPAIAPATFPVVAGMERVIAAPQTQLLNGTDYDFVLWSDGGAPTHVYTVPLTNSTVVASYVPPVISHRVVGSSLQLSWPAWAGPLALYSATNLSPPIQWAPVGGVPTASDGQLTLPVPVDNGQGFFRLATPP